MKAVCVVYNEKTYLGPLIFFILQIGLHAWGFEAVIQYYYIFGPLLLTSTVLFFVVRFKNPGTIPIVKAEIPIENNQIEVQIENNVKREVLNAQANDESNVQISLDQFKDAPENDNTIQKYYQDQPQQQEKENQVSDTKFILSGREILSSPSSDQTKINTPNKQTCISTTNALTPPVVEGEKRFCVQCLNEQPIRAKHCQYCKKCIPMFDHHCPWIGICIGEKNKLLFIIYLFFQISQLIVAIKILVFNVGILVIMGILVILLITLTSFHLFYIAKNVTTWEFLSWKRITYISEKKRYPFDKGVLNNLKLFLKISLQSQIFDWQLSQQ